MKKKIVQLGNEILRKKAKEVAVSKIKSKEIQDLLKEMIEVLKGEEIGVGLAASQVGIDKQIFILKDPKKNNYSVFINPKIIKLSREGRLMSEGCLSVRDYWGKVKRAAKVLVVSFDGKGDKFEKNFSGLAAQIFQHEVDHLNGVLFVDKAKELEKSPNNLKSK